MKRALLVALFGFSFSTAHAGFLVGSGETGFDFLKIPMAARPAALGNSFTAMEGDVSALDYNPAGLTGLERMDIGLSHQSYFEDASLDSVSIAYPFYVPFLGPSKAGPNGYDAGNLAVGAQYKQFEANDASRDAQGIPTGEFNLRDQLFQMTAAYDAGRFAFGGGWKLIKDKIQQEQRRTSAFDGGLLFRPGGAWTFGASIINMGPSKEFVDEKDPLPTTVRGGAVYQWRKWNFLGDLVETRDKNTEPSFGAEWSANQYVKLRAGMRYHTTFEPSAGIGIFLSDIGGDEPKKKPAHHQTTDGKRTLGGASGAGPVETVDTYNHSIAFGLDYAVRNHETLGIVHTFTLKILY